MELEYLGQLHAHSTDNNMHSSDTECSDEEEEEENSPETEWRPLAPPEPAAPPANAPPRPAKRMKKSGLKPRRKPTARADPDNR